MSKLEDFLGLTDVSEVRETITESFDGKTFKFVIRPLNEREHSDFQKRATIVTKKNVSFDRGKYNELTLQNCIVEPNFADASFLSKVGCQTSTEFLNRKFPAGVLDDIAVKIQKLSGFDTFEMEIEEAKN